MQIQKTILATLDMVYAIGSIELDGNTHFLAATEATGPCLLFSPPDWTVSTVLDGPGGVMSLVPIPGRNGAFLAIQEFFPIFDSETAGIAYVEIGEDKTKPWKNQRILDLPFIHRLETVKGHHSTYMVAATLCGGKDYTDDWSRPGAVYVGSVPEDPRGQWSLRPVLEGITKNHGMHISNIQEKQIILISGQEGLFSLEVPDSPEESWQSEQLLCHEISDLYVGDIDGDGQPEIVTIEPFHGNSLVVYRLSGQSLQPICSWPLDFGHVVWAGNILGEPAILAGNRGGEKELTLLRFRSSGQAMLEPTVLDRGVGPTQIAVVNEKSRDLIISANHGIGEVALYEMTA